MKHVAFATYKENPQLTESDALLVRPLLQKGIISSPVAWNSKTADWTKFDAIILRSTWDYQFHYTSFSSWLSYLKTIQVQVHNPIPIIQWNSDKSYILDLAKKGVHTVPTVLHIKGETNNVEDIMKDFGSKECVIKPTIGASASGVTRVNLSEYKKSEKIIQKLLAENDCLIQPLMNEVMSEGEYSFVFIGNTFSHAILKKPKLGEFRSNHEFGAKEQVVNPHKTLVDQAANILNTAQNDLLYARVDGINRNGKFILMELELIEPHLFFDKKPMAATLFAQTLKTYVSHS
jgi:glutathione synthase/RimK-type ligase-like ATP-grasp enzyme